MVDSTLPDKIQNIQQLYSKEIFQPFQCSQFFTNRFESVELFLFFGSMTASCRRCKPEYKTFMGLNFSSSSGKNHNLDSWKIPRNNMDGDHENDSNGTDSVKMSYFWDKPYTTLLNWTIWTDKSSSYFNNNENKTQCWCLKKLNLCWRLDLKLFVDTIMVEEWQKEIFSAVACSWVQNVHQ